MQIIHWMAGIKFVIDADDQVIEISAPELGTAEPLLWVDTLYMDPDTAGDESPLTGHVAVYLTDPQGRSDGAIAIGVYKPDGLVVGASEGGVPTDVSIYGPLTQPGFAMEVHDE
jgi:hypothetical protein